MGKALIAINIERIAVHLFTPTFKIVNKRKVNQSSYIEKILVCPCTNVNSDDFIFDNNWTSTLPSISTKPIMNLNFFDFNDSIISCQSIMM